MYLKYGNYTHALNEAAILISKDGVLNDAQVPYAERERWEITGVLQADTQAALTTAIQALESAYSVGGLDLTLLLDDGSTPTAHRMVSSNSIGGTRVIGPPSYPAGTGAEYSTFRTYRIAVEAEFSTGLAMVLQWDELLTFTGGGPRDVLIELRNGLPQKQRVSQATVFRVTQSGKAVGYANWPTPPPPIWPDAEDRPSRQVSPKLPKTTGRGVSRTRSDYEISWSYQFHSASPLSGFPSRRP